MRRGHHPIVLAITGLNIAFALVYALLVPMYRGPDEAAHVDMIRRYRADASEPSPNVAVPVESVVRNVYRDGTLERAYRPPLPLRARDAMRRADRPTFATLGRPTVESSNQMTQHPPLYYAVAAGTAGDMTVSDLQDDRSRFLEGSLHHGENSHPDPAQALHR